MVLATNCPDWSTKEMVAGGLERTKANRTRASPDSEVWLWLASTLRISGLTGNEKQPFGLLLRGNDGLHDEEDKDSHWRLSVIVGLCFSPVQGFDATHTSSLFHFLGRRENVPLRLLMTSEPLSDVITRRLRFEGCSFCQFPSRYHVISGRLCGSQPSEWQLNWCVRFSGRLTAACCRPPCLEVGSIAPADSDDLDARETVEQKPDE